MGTNYKAFALEICNSRNSFAGQNLKNKSFNYISYFSQPFLRLNMGFEDINTCRLEPNDLYRLNRAYFNPFIVKTSNTEMCFFLLNMLIKS